MGYPMTYQRVINRNHLRGDYAWFHKHRIEDQVACHEQCINPSPLIAGDLRRLEQDSRDGQYGKQIAEAAGVSPEVAVAVLTAFFTDCGRCTVEGGGE
jgi:hypothetical protein